MNHRCMNPILRDALVMFIEQRQKYIQDHIVKSGFFLEKSVDEALNKEWNTLDGLKEDISQIELCSEILENKKVNEEYYKKVEGVF